MPHRFSRDHTSALTRRQTLLAGAAGGAALLVPRLGRAALTAYVLECNKSNGFLPDPNQHYRVGFVTALAGFNGARPLTFAQDLQIAYAWTGGAPRYAAAASAQANAVGMRTMKVVGVLEKLAWSGGVGDPLTLDFWVSQANAVQLKSAQQATITSTKVDQLGFWIANYDQESKVWYENAYPASAATVSGVVSPLANPLLNVDLIGSAVKDGIDVMAYKISMQVSPAANTKHTLQLATSSSSQSIKPWGLPVGSPATGATR
jgi:hypothetical protein